MALKDALENLRGLSGRSHGRPVQCGETGPPCTTAVNSDRCNLAASFCVATVSLRVRGRFHLDSLDLRRPITISGLSAPTGNRADANDVDFYDSLENPASRTPQALAPPTHYAPTTTKYSSLFNATATTAKGRWHGFDFAANANPSVLRTESPPVAQGWMIQIPVWSLAHGCG